MVNADDWGLSPSVTDTIAGCFACDGISSATAMVWMRDSRRAASLARDRDLPIGLHLNLDTAFDGEDVPRSVRADHARVISWFRKMPAAAPALVPSFQRAVRALVHAQLEQFVELYGRQPTHLDGHHHLHLAAPVLRSGALPARLPIRLCHRPSRGFWARAWRARQSRLVRRRHRTTDFFCDLRRIHPHLGGTGLHDALSQAAHASLEVMVHPGFPDEPGILCSPSWREAIQGYRVGSFADLAVRCAPRSIRASSARALNSSAED
ncbi:MAG: ChbG/HpnK family deacetylase [Solirubrobacteraceae bacterium]